MLSITGERIILRDHLITDLDDMHEWMSDKEIMRFLPGIKTSSREGTRNQLLESIQESQNPDRTKYFFAMVLKTGCGIIFTASRTGSMDHLCLKD